MVAYATIVYLVCVSVVMFVYTLLYDLYLSLWNIALASGVSSDVMGVLYSVHIYYPAAFFLSMTFWYIIQSQKKGSAY